MAREKAHFEDPHRARFGKINVLRRRCTQIVAAQGDEGALARKQGVDFSLCLRQVRMGGKELLPAAVGLLQLFEGIKGVEGKRFARSGQDRKSTRLNSSHGYISYAVFCLKKKIY